MTDFAEVLGRRPGRGLGGRLIGLAVGGSVLALAAAPIAYMLWPQPKPVSADAPSLPITIGGVPFNVPPAAIRVPMQRGPGAQSRIDLVFLWPSLTPPDLTLKPSPAAPPNIGERLFVTIAGSDGMLPPAERLKVIYPRYTEGVAVAGPDGLEVRHFRASTPYQGEELIHDPSAPERFLLRCTRKIAATPGMCLNERRIATAYITIRFPREWLADWRAVASGIDRLIAGMRPAGS